MISVQNYVVVSYIEQMNKFVWFCEIPKHAVENGAYLKCPFHISQHPSKCHSHYTTIVNEFCRIHEQRHEKLHSLMIN